MNFLRCLLGIVAMAFVALAAQADYPSRPIRIVVPFAAGGPADAVARVLATELAARLGQPVIIDDRPGAQGAVAGQEVSAAPADGYTLLYAVSATAALPVVTSTTYEMTRDFAPITTIGTYDFGLFISTSVPATTVRELVAYAKAHPGKLNVATLNLGEQYAAASLMHATGIEMMLVPYRSMAQILPDMVRGEVHLYFGPLSNLALAKDRRVRVLATLSASRSAFAPEVPTMGESGLPDVTFASTQMLFAPARTPPAIVEKLSREVNVALTQPEVRAKLESLTLRVKGSTPEELRRAQAVADVAWARIAREYRLGAE